MATVALVGRASKGDGKDAFVVATDVERRRSFLKKSKKASRRSMWKTSQNMLMMKRDKEELEHDLEAQEKVRIEKRKRVQVSGTMKGKGMTLVCSDLPPPHSRSCSSCSLSQIPPGILLREPVSAEEEKEMHDSSSQ